VRICCAIHWPLGCFEMAHHWPKSASYCDIATSIPRRFMPRSMNLPCADWHCHGQEVRYERAPASPQ
jgi:hypothetical protein